MKEAEAILQILKDVFLIHLNNWKRNSQACDSHRGFCLLLIARKILANILLNRLDVHRDQAGVIPESQCGLRKDSGTTDIIFTANSFRRYAKNTKNICMTFVDLTKALDTVVMGKRYK